VVDSPIRDAGSVGRRGGVRSRHFFGGAMGSVVGAPQNHSLSLLGLLNGDCPSF
jgi:hypothetical protein